MSEYIIPDWPAPEGILALGSLRTGGVSLPPFDSLNLGLHVGDDSAAVLANRARLGRYLPGANVVQWLNQVHGTRCVPASVQGQALEADACWTQDRGLACAVMSADCLPVLLCDRRGSVVAAAHAGWRGLVNGVLESVIGAMSVAPAELMAWFGPAIGPQAFEVGAEVRTAFLATDPGTKEHTGKDQALVACFREAGRPDHYLADLRGLARWRLQRLGVKAIYGADDCTFSQPERFFSYRRDGRTGRMASLIWLVG
ncbi:MAG: peptidoglycan editing factor PgeF [Parahaliea sp.]